MLATLPSVEATRVALEAPGTFRRGVGGSVQCVTAPGAASGSPVPEGPLPFSASCFPGGLLLWVVPPLDSAYVLKGQTKWTLNEIVGMLPTSGRTEWPEHPHCPVSFFGLCLNCCSLAWSSSCLGGDRSGASGKDWKEPGE